MVRPRDHWPVVGAVVGEVQGSVLLSLGIGKNWSFCLSKIVWCVCTQMEIKLAFAVLPGAMKDFNTHCPWQMKVGIHMLDMPAEYEQRTWVEFIRLLICSFEEKTFQLVDKKRSKIIFQGEEKPVKNYFKTFFFLRTKLLTTFCENICDASFITNATG